MPPAKVHTSRHHDRSDEAAVAAGRHELSPAGPRDDAAAPLPDRISTALAGFPPCYVADRAGILHHANAAYLGLAQRLLGAAAAITPPPSLLPLADIIAEIEAIGGPVTQELEIGEPALVLRLRHTAIYGDDGVLSAIAGTIEDITELAALRRKLSITNDRLDDITRLASDWIWETDAKLAITFVSPRVTEVLGFQPIELLGRSFLDIGRFAASRDDEHPLDPKRRTPFRDLPFMVAHRDGSLRLFHVASLPVFCPRTGDFLGFRGTARDVTEQEAASFRATQSQNQLSQAIENISEGFSLFDADDRLVLCNGKFRSYFPGAGELLIPGISFGEILRRALDSGDLVVPAEQREEWLAERLRLRREANVSFEMPLANDRWIRISDHKTADGSIVGIRTDITDLKRREEALFAAKETAEIANRSKSEFLANISHELRTPLNAIIGFSEIMREQIFGPLGSPQYLEYTSDVLDSAHHLLEVINDILDIAKAEAGKLELAEDEVDVAHVVKAATRLVQERAQRVHVTLRTRLAEDLPQVHADERKLKQILLNLLTNSVKFTPPDGIIEVGARLSPSGDMLISVTDSGIGIAAEDIATALAPFGQVDSKLNRKYEGTGLGLPLCNAMVRLHGGELTIASVVGKGTAVTIRLPAMRVRKG